ncbi:MAG TPA: Fe-S protein assembly co-chaperone HscB [Terriglobales bacterium]|nr:Fe-S protein assembly co-chaperone HscB [Terriglobales bacterium]
MPRKSKSDSLSESALQVLNGNGEHASCWSCGDMVAAHFCNACGKVQPAVPADYFSFFGLPRKLNIDLSALEREMYQLSRRLHPDLYTQASEQEQTWSLEQTSQLNDAYRTLRDPIARTRYLLILEGFKSEEQSIRATETARTSGQPKQSPVPAELLEEVFEINMQLEELHMNKKTAEDDYALTAEVQQAQHKFEQKLRAMQGELRTLWSAWDTLIDRSASGDTATTDERRVLCLKMLGLLNRHRYVQHLVREISDALES